MIFTRSVVVRLQCATKQRRHTEQVKHSFPHTQSTYNFGSVVVKERATPCFGSRELNKALIVSTNVEKICRCNWSPALLQQRHDLFGFVICERPQQYGVHNTEDRG